MGELMDNQRFCGMINYDQVIPHAILMNSWATESLRHTDDFWYD